MSRISVGTLDRGVLSQLLPSDGLREFCRWGAIAPHGTFKHQVSTRGRFWNGDVENASRFSHLRPHDNNRAVEAVWPPEKSVSATELPARSASESVCPSCLNRMADRRSYCRR